MAFDEKLISKKFMSRGLLEELRPIIFMKYLIYITISTNITSISPFMEIVTLDVH